MINRYLECGKIVTTHGVAGDVKVESYCDTPSILSSLKRVYTKEGSLYKEHIIKHSFVLKGAAVLRLELVEDIDAAQKMRGSILYAAREDIPKADGAYFIADLIGLDVIDVCSGRAYGKITDVINRGASDIYVINTKSGEVLFPAVEEFIDRIDIEKAVYIRVIEGMFEDEV